MDVTKEFVCINFCLTTDKCFEGETT